MSADASIARAMVAALDDAALDALAAQLAPRIAALATDGGDRRAYTVATLAAELSVSPRTVRAAIERGELPAVKRGGRWIVGADAVTEWTRPMEAPAPRVARRRAASGGSGTLAAIVAGLDGEAA